MVTTATVITAAISKKVESKDTVPMSPTGDSADGEAAEAAAMKKRRDARRGLWRCYGMVCIVVLALAVALPLGAVFLFSSDGNSSSKTAANSASGTGAGGSSSSQESLPNVDDEKDSATTVFVEPTVVETTKATEAPQTEPPLIVTDSPTLPPTEAPTESPTTASPTTATPTVSPTEAPTSAPTGVIFFPVPDNNVTKPVLLTITN